MKIKALAAALLVAACASQTYEPRVATELPFGGAEVPRSGARMPAEDAVLTRIQFGSCLKQEDPAPILGAMIARRPDLTVFLGDNVYGDVRDMDDPLMPELVGAYRTLGARRDFQSLLSVSPVLSTWDDHDYGRNDRGGEFPLKENAEVLFEEFWNLPQDDVRRARQGVYTSETFGPEGQRVQIILLDTRFFRSALTRTDERNAPGKERYIPSDDPDQTMLGTVQERWLGEVLEEPADLRILVTSIQLIADGHGWEAWATMPEARDRIYRQIAAAGTDNLIVISGDRHLGGFYERELAPGMVLDEMTTSSLNAPQSTWRERDGRTSHEAGPHRLGLPIYEENFGELTIDWDVREATMSLRDIRGEEIYTRAKSF
ncbi:alkaline phosphatase family protein [Parvularcula sp. ZS-1/3]|uniref:Alkaline phosphatase family protein n=1 Tax=Parvularcula mediterranea TaxID=2732508 RepID=A0A7Y3W4X7_9PROT|nr:alkaline phosphatase D family protein [Parvularcula mediterranea]NNU15651.1 alkaline phosphatase family protein [Parvularcula mediterranea]